MTEMMMEHISKVTGIDPLAVRVENLPADSKLREMIPTFVSNIRK